MLNKHTQPSSSQEYEKLRKSKPDFLIIYFTGVLTYYV